MSRRDDLVGAALLVVADGGLKGLTHRAVDARAGLPVGSTANLFRDRDSLVRAVLAEMQRRDRELFDVPPSLRVENPGELAVLLAQGIARMVEPSNAPLTRVRLTMSLAYPEEVAPLHRRLLAELESVMRGLEISDAPGRAGTVAALMDGVLLHELTVAPDRFDVESLAAGIRSLLTGSGSSR